MKACKSDPCVLYWDRAKDDEHKPAAVVALQVDDAYGHGNDLFLREKERYSSRFICKPRKVLTPGCSAQFNGTRISVCDNALHKLDQTSKLKALKFPKTKEDLIRVRAQIQYIATCTRPNLCAAVQLMASEVTNACEDTFKKMSTIAARCHQTQNVGLRFVPLDTSSLRIALFTDASFANNKAKKSQMGFVIVLCDSNGDANILYYGSTACNRVTRSVMAAELLGLVYGFDNAYLLQHMLTEILGYTVPVDAYADSKIVFDIIAKRGPTLEKRLQIDAHALRESHLKGELRILAWIEGKDNVADGLTKSLINSKHPLWKLITTNKLETKPQGWVSKQ